MSGMPTAHTPPSAASATAVVIPHLDRLADTAVCCHSLAAQTLPPRAIFVIDNGSSAHTADDLQAACPNATVVRLAANAGFAGAVNTGIRRALELPEVGFVWVLNNDTRCPPETLAGLLAAAGAEPQVGLAATPLVENHGGRRCRIAPGKRLRHPWMVPVPMRPGRAPDYLCGASLLIRREMIEDVGLLDEGFFFFFEDVDYSLRARARGWRLAVAAAEIEHTGSATIGALGERQARYYRAGHVRLLRRYSRHPLAAAFPPFGCRLLADALRLRRAALRGTLAGWREGWRQHVTTEPPLYLHARIRPTAPR
jgi:GT2 family glycosyltransferase